MSKKALIIDGNSLVYRAYYATEGQIQYFIDNDLFPTNALRLMIDLCWKLRHKKEYDYLIMAFDAGKVTFRTEMFNDYKSNRCKMPDELVMQLPIIHQSMELLGFNIFKKMNIEADDIIGSSANILSTLNDIEIDIYSSDKDILQLVNKKTKVFMIKQGITNVIEYNQYNFKELTNGLIPQQIPDFKAIVGDKSDNIPGVKGIGEMTGIKLLTEYNNLEEIYKNLDKLSNKIKEKFETEKDKTKLYKKLATIKTDLYTSEDIKMFIAKDVNNNLLKNIINEFNLNSLEKYFK